jgi:hypothetical protein
MQGLNATNGFRVRGLNADCDRLACQSSVASTWFVGRHRFPSRGRDVGMTQNELVILRPHGGNPEVELQGLGGPHGVLIVESTRGGKFVLRNGQKRTFELPNDERLVLKTENWRAPGTEGAQFRA